MNAKTIDEIIAAGDAEQAFLYWTDDNEAAEKDSRTSEQINSLMTLASSWLAGMQGEHLVSSILNKLSTDTARRIFLKHAYKNGFGGLIKLFADEKVAMHRPLILDMFVIQIDDPGYIDTMLDKHAKLLSDAEKLRLLAKKQSLG